MEPNKHNKAMQTSLILLIFAFAICSLPQTLAATGRVAVVELWYNGSMYHVTGMYEDKGFAPLDTQTKGIPINITITSASGTAKQTLYLPTTMISEATEGNDTLLHGGYSKIEPYKSVRIVELPLTATRITITVDGEEVRLPLSGDNKIQKIIYVVLSLFVICIVGFIFFYSRRRR